MSRYNHKKHITLSFIVIYDNIIPKGRCLIWLITGGCVTCARTRT